MKNITYCKYCNVPEIVDLRVKFFTGNELKRVLGENARSFIEGILSVRQGTPHLYCIQTKKLSCLKSGLEFDMNDILYEFKNLHHFQDSLTFGVKAV